MLTAREVRAKGEVPACLRTESGQDRRVSRVGSSYVTNDALRATAVGESLCRIKQTELLGLGGRCRRCVTGSLEGFGELTD